MELGNCQQRLDKQAFVATYVVSLNIMEPIPLGKILGDGALAATRGPGNDEDIVLWLDRHVGRWLCGGS